MNPVRFEAGRAKEVEVDAAGQDSARVQLEIDLVGVPERGGHGNGIARSGAHRQRLVGKDGVDQRNCAGRAVERIRHDASTVAAGIARHRRVYHRRPAAADIDAAARGPGLVIDDGVAAQCGVAVLGDGDAAAPFAGLVAAHDVAVEADRAFLQIETAARRARGVVFDDVVFQRDVAQTDIHTAAVEVGMVAADGYLAEARRVGAQ